MKFLVIVNAPAERGAEIEAAGGPGPVVGEIMSRFHPEIFYGTANRRQLIFVADLDTAIDVSVLLEICSARLFAYPELTPVIPLAELQTHVEAVHRQLGVTTAVAPV
jgi:hypothetical protein